MRVRASIYFASQRISAIINQSSNQNTNKAVIKNQSSSRHRSHLVACSAKPQSSNTKERAVFAQ